MPRVPEIDLHGLTVEQALARFAAEYARVNAARRATRLMVIHGYNANAFQGSIADSLHRLLQKSRVSYDYPVANNPGRTSVRIGPPLATPSPPRPRTRAVKKKAPRRKLSGGL